MPSMIYVFCGNDLLEHSIKVENSASAPCVNPSYKRCGGPQLLSLYKIRGELRVLGTVSVLFAH